jgi:hypothetical protein
VCERFILAIFFFSGIGLGWVVGLDGPLCIWSLEFGVELELESMCLSSFWKGCSFISANERRGEAGSGK